jgi:two-component system chemotaxis response regulator CheY
MNVLFVDDSKTMRDIQAAAVATLGPLAATEAADGLEALKAIAAAAVPFDLILVDWNMPNMNGLELLKAVRKTDRRTPMIMVTTEGEKDRVMEAIRAGANNYVLKPFDAEDLIAKVRSTLAKAKAKAA